MSRVTRAGVLLAIDGPTRRCRGAIAMHRSGLRSRLVAIAGTNHPFATVSGAKRSAAVVACVDGGNSIPHWMHSLTLHGSATLQPPLTTHKQNRARGGWRRGPRLLWARWPNDRTNRRTRARNGTRVGARRRRSDFTDCAVGSG